MHKGTKRKTRKTRITRNKIRGGSARPSVERKRKLNSIAYSKSKSAKKTIPEAENRPPSPRALIRVGRSNAFRQERPPSR
jgi:hypothetical protein